MTATGGRRLKVLLAIAGAITVYVIATAGKESGGDATTARHTETGARQRATPDTGAAVPTATVPLLAARLAHRVTAGRAADALFARHSWYVAPPPPPPAPVVEVTLPPPTAPPLPFVIMGSYARPGDSTVYFLTRDDRVFDVHVGDTIDGTYKVASAANGQLLLTYLPLNIRQSLPIGAAQ